MKIQYIMTILGTIKYVKNWWDVFLIYFEKKEKANIIFRSGFVIKGIRKKCFSYPCVLVSLGRIMKKYEVRQNRKEIIINGVGIPINNLTPIPAYECFFDNGGTIHKEKGLLIAQLKNIRLILPNETQGIREFVEVFIQKGYDKYDFRNKTVLDIGGFIGDTAVFFALTGAKKVVVYEPNPELYKIALKNIKLLHCKKKIEIYNLAVGDKNGKISLIIPTDYGSSTLYPSSLQKNKSFNTKKVNVNLISISNIFNKIGVVDILKMDCEGSEYPILEEILKKGLQDKIKEGIILEAHNVDEKRNPKYAKELLVKLGFGKFDKVKHDYLQEVITAYKQ